MANFGKSVVDRQQTSVVVPETFGKIASPINNASQKMYTGREEPLEVGSTHAVLNTSTKEPFPHNLHLAMFGMGCFWGVERKFWQIDGVYSTQVGFAGGYTPNPTYKEVCTRKTGHAEVVRVMYDPAKVTYAQLLQVFWENHDPTQRLDIDITTQYRSVIFYDTAEEKRLAETTKADVQKQLTALGYGEITAEIIPMATFYYAEDYHQQYLHKNPDGFCGLKSVGISCPI